MMDARMDTTDDASLSSGGTVRPKRATRFRIEECEATEAVLRVLDTLKGVRRLTKRFHGWSVPERHESVVRAAMAPVVSSEPPSGKECPPDLYEYDLPQDCVGLYHTIVGRSVEKLSRVENRA